MVKQEYELQRASLHAWSRTEGGQLRAAVGIVLRKRWLDREQELITVIQEEIKRTGEKEEAVYRSPTWSILRALQKINKDKKLEGEAIMSAPPFFSLRDEEI